MVTNKTNTLRRIVEKMRLNGNKTNIHERIDNNDIVITEEFQGSAGGRVIKGRFDVRINTESLGYYYYGHDKTGHRMYDSRPLAFEAIKQDLPLYSYFLK